MFVFGLVAVSSLIETTNANLIDRYSQVVSLNQLDPKLLYGMPGQKINIQFEGKRSVGGVFIGKNLVLTLREPGNQAPLLQVDDIAVSDWQIDALPANNTRDVMVVPVTIDLPGTLKIGTQLEGELTGAVAFPTEQKNSLVEERAEINQKFIVQIVNEDEMLKQVRQRPILIMVLSFPIAIIMILLGIRSDLFGRKSRPKL